MQFLSLRAVFKYCDMSHAPINSENLQIAKEKLIAEQKDTVLLKSKAYTAQEILFFLESLDDKKIIFQDWIDTNSQLSFVLNSGNFKTKYDDDKRLKGHFLFNEFKIYLGQFLYESIRTKILTGFESEEYEVVNIVDSYSTLLVKQNKENIELLVDTELRQLVLDRKQNLPKIKSSEELMNEMSFITNDNVIEIYNRQVKTFYNSKLELVNFSVELFQNKYFTPQYAKRVFQSVKKLELNPEHQDQIRNLNANVKSGKVKMTNASSIFSFKKLKSISSGTIVLATFVLTIVAIIFIFTREDQKLAKVKPNSHGGFDSLSVEQLKEVDSLFDFEKDTLILEIEDVNLPTTSNSAYVVTTSTLELNNKKLIQLQKDLLIDFDLQNQQSFTGSIYTDCNSLRAGLFRDFNMSGVEKITSNKGFEHTLENTSSYDVYCIVFNDVADGEVFGVLIPKGGKVNIQLSKKQYILFYAGNDMSKFSPARSENQGYGNINDAKKVSKNFNYHFCYQDDKTYALLNKVYLVEGNNVNSSTRMTDSNALGLIVNSEVIKKKN